MADLVESRVVMLQDGLDAFEGLADGVVAEVVVEVFEIVEADVTKGPRGLVEIVGGAGASGWAQRGDKVNLHEAVEAFVENLGRDFEQVADLRGGGGREAGLEAAADGEQYD